MDFNLGWNNRQDSKGVPPETSYHSHFADQSRQVPCTGLTFRQNHQEFFQQGPPLLPSHLHGGISREIEKERVTEEILMAEIVKRRSLEYEVKMIERELALLRREQHLSFQPFAQMNRDLQLQTRFPLSLAEECSSLEERLSTLLDGIKKINFKHGSQGYDTQDKKDENISGSRKMMDLSPSESGSNELLRTVDPHSEHEVNLRSGSFLSNENVVVESTELKSPPLEQNSKWGNLKIPTNSTVREERSCDARNERSFSCVMCNVGPLPWHSMIDHLQGKRHASLLVRNHQKRGELSKRHVSASKKMDLAPSEVGSTSSKLPETDKAKQNNRNEWFCALCKFSATSELALNKHLEEKTRKCMVNAMRRENPRKHYSIGLLPKSSTSFTNVDPPHAEQEANLTAQQFLSNGTEVEELRNQDSVPLQQNIKLGYLKSQTISAVRKEKSVDSSKGHVFWCDTCKIGPGSFTMIVDHLKGKKHANRQLSQQNSTHDKFKDETGSALMGKVSDHARKKYMFWCGVCQHGPSSYKGILGHEKGKKHADHMALLKMKDLNCGAGRSDFEPTHANQVARSEKMSSDNVDKTSDTIKFFIGACGHY